MVSVSQHEKNLRELRCVVTNNPQVTLHHCHGASMKEMGWHVGMGQKQNPFLQIPLKADYHTGDMGVDRIGVETWEERFGRQWDYLVGVNDLLPYNIFAEAVRWEEENRKGQLNTTTRRSTGET